ncbi:MAG: hypothetical protein IIT65_12555 [Lachnospiraceae bacterium]|nr:hypothetical protein [Lachnospiraceae bacterium]
MNKTKVKKKSFLKSLWNDKEIRFGIISFLMALSVLFLFILIPKKTTVQRNGHTLQVYSSQYAPVHDPLMCDKCIQENKAKADTIDLPY